MSFTIDLSARLRFQAVIFSMLVAVLGFASEAAAVLLDFVPTNADYNGNGIVDAADYVLWRKTPNNFNGTPVGYNTWRQNFGKSIPGSSGDFNDVGNWIDYTTSDMTLVPTTADEAIVRSGGTLNITTADGDASAAVIRIGAGPQALDPVGPPFYGGNGTLNWSGGNILGTELGPRLFVGERDNTNNINFTGIVNHSGGKISLNTPTSFGARLVVGSNGTTPTPTSIYNLMPGGTIGVTETTGDNRGINIRNGTFNMTGGNIVSDDTPANPSQSQRAITVSDTSGTLGSENVAYANFSGGSVYVNGGMRLAATSHTKAYATISGNANVHFRAVDVQLGANATNSYAQLDMSGGSFKVGDINILQDRRLIIGDSGTGVFNLSGGTVNLNHSLVVGNNVNTAKGTLTQTGGTLIVRSIETSRQNTSPNLAVEDSAIIIDGPSAVFTQQNTIETGQTGQTTIGQVGKSRFELRQGQANLREVRLSQNPTSRATLNVFGGKLTIQDGVTRGNVTADEVNNNTPTINLTGGELELTPAASVVGWQADMHLMGTDFDPKPGALLGTSVGSISPNRPANFSLNSGSVWDLNIANGTLSGADYMNVPNGTAALNGGVLNIIPIGGYTPANGDTVRIVISNAPVTLNIGAVTVSDPNWVLQLGAGNTEIQLKYGATGFGNGGAVPEPAAIVLVGLFASVSLSSRRPRCGKR